MSVLHREISQDQANMQTSVRVTDDHPLQWKMGLDDSNESMNSSEFQPASLQSLSEEKRMTASDDSDALFHSAELEFDGIYIYSFKVSTIYLCRLKYVL